MPVARWNSLAVTCNTNAAASRIGEKASDLPRGRSLGEQPEELETT